MSLKQRALEAIIRDAREGDSFSVNSELEIMQLLTRIDTGSVVPINNRDYCFAVIQGSVTHMLKCIGQSVCVCVNQGKLRITVK